MALAGGVVLVALILLTCISVVGRGLNTFGHSDFLQNAAEGLANTLLGTGVGPVNGDFEIVEAGIAFAIFSFLPICQLFSAHATVDVFTSFLSKRTNAVIITFWEIVFTVIVLLITWRLYYGLEDKLGNGETSLLLQFPIWWAFLASFIAAVVASLVAVYCAVGRIMELTTDQHWLPKAEGAAH
ncbi:TRAP transporter small permease [Vannielia sp. SX4]|uniref:TRAP transporter small permease n=1 Tax=Vannielia sp. SX4 TaxID=3463852 RepID=UPI004059F146